MGVIMMGMIMTGCEGSDYFFDEADLAQMVISMLDDGIDISPVIAIFLFDKYLLQLGIR